MSKYIFLVSLVAVTLAAVLSLDASAKLESFEYKNKNYYQVFGDDPEMNSGNKVCAKAGLSCVGYTSSGTNEICKHFHPDASSTSSVNGSKSGFYCNGAPQKGLACEKALNNCQNCPNCNVNATCDTQIGDQFKEMYVECADTNGTVKVNTGFIERVHSWFSNWWGKLTGIFADWRNLFNFLTISKKVTIQVQGPKGVTSSTEIPPDSVVCEFYQTNKKLVTCAAYKKADEFCVQAMQSRFARAALCEENGVVICTNPCHPSEYQLPIKQCAFDNDRSRGKQAPPLDFCDQTIKVQMNLPTQGVKKAGQVCQHGGECATGFCLGQPSDSGIKYFCSCKQNLLDFTCGK